MNTTKDYESEEEEPFEIDLTEDHYCGNLNSEIVGDFVCILCYGIVFKPIKCKTCETLICSNCVNSQVLTGQK